MWLRLLWMGVGSRGSAKREVSARALADDWNVSQNDFSTLHVVSWLLHHLCVEVLPPGESGPHSKAGYGPVYATSS